MKIFLDANVLISVVNQEYPLFSYSSRVLSLADDPKFQVYSSPLCLAITYYFAEKKSGNKMALKKLKILSEKLSMTTMDQKAVNNTVSNPKISDFEDGLEYYSAIDSGCSIIITQDSDDFYFSDILVTDCVGFVNEFAKY